MTEAQAIEAERLWVSDRERQRVLATLRAVGVDESELEAARGFAATSEADAVKAILIRVAHTAPELQRRKLAFHSLAVAAERRNERSSDYWAQAIKCELLRLKECGVGFVTVSKPRPWAPAAQMVQLHEQGHDTDAIARITGYSVPTV